MGPTIFLQSVSPLLALLYNTKSDGVSSVKFFLDIFDQI